MPSRSKPLDVAELKSLGEQYYWPPRQMAGDFSEETGIRVIAKGQGVWVEDVEGRRFIDLQAGYWLSILGHGREEIAQAVQRQLSEVAFAPQTCTSPVTVQLAARLGRLAPGGNSRVFFTSGGSEAVESALKMAKQYHLLRGEGSRYKVISRRTSFHGNTQACSSFGTFRYDGMGVPIHHGPAVPGAVHVAPPSRSKCHLCRAAGRCTLECAKDIERAILFEGPSTVAAVIGEPISGSGGVHIPDPGYWPEVQAICKRHGVLLILDEVVTGFGRTGKLLAASHWNVEPDLLVVAKGLSSGYAPLGAVLASRPIADAFMGKEEATFRHLFTYSGHPGACAAGMAAMDILEREGLVENSRVQGARLFEGLKSLQRHRVVGEVRGGLGLLAAFDIVRDRATGEPLPKELDLRARFRRLFPKHGLVGAAGNVIIVGPPLVATAKEVDLIVERLDAVLGELVRELPADV